MARTDDGPRVRSRPSVWSDWGSVVTLSTRMLRMGLLVATVIATLANVVHAQGDALWERGVALRAERRDAEALAVFEQAHRESGSARTLAQVALAEQALGRWGAAGTHLDEALARPDAWVHENQAALLSARAEIARRTGLLEVTVDHPGARIMVDGREVGRSPLAAPVIVTAGTVTLRVEKNGVVVDRSVAVAVGQSAREDVALGPAAAGGGGALPITGAVLIAVGGLSAIGMAIAWGLREADAQAYNSDDCWEIGRTRDEVCGDLRSAVDTEQGLAIGLGVGAAVLLGVGIGLVAADGAGGGDRAHFACAPGLGGVACRGRF